MSAPDVCAAFLKALHEDKDRVTDIVHEKIVESPSIALNRIPDGGMTNFNDNLDTIEYNRAKQAFKSYEELNDDPKDLTAGNLAARDCAGTTGSFATLVNEEDEDACHDSCLLEFGQGYKTYTSKIYRFAVTTPVVCAFDYIRMGKEHVRAYFDGFTENFTEYGMENFEANLLNFVIQFGEANASVNSKNEIVLTQGGFNAPPLYRLSIPFLRRYRQYMIREGGVTDEGLLEIETTRQDALDAIAADQDAMGNKVSINVQTFEDVRGALYSKEGIIYNGIKFIFNEMPVRGYFKPSGQTAGGQQLHTFVRVYHWKNEANEAGGVGTEPNHEYDAPYVTCEGVRYPMVTLAFVINAKSFMRYGLGKPMKAHGEENAGANYEMLVLDKAYIQNNDYNDRFRLAARHMFRFKTMKPELSGAIAYRHSVPCDYVIEPCTDPVEVPTEEFSSPQDFEECDTRTDCVTADVVGILEMTPCAEATTVFDGEASSVIIRVERTGDGVGTRTIDYATADGTAEDENGAGDYTATSGTLSWADGETGVKEIEVPITGATAATQDFTLTLSNIGGTGTDTLADCDEVTITIIDGQ